MNEAPPGGASWIGLRAIVDALGAAAAAAAGYLSFSSLALKPASFSTLITSAGAKSPSTTNDVTLGFTSLAENLRFFSKTSIGSCAGLGE